MLRKKVLLDIILNLIANILPIFVLQFFILPKVAQKISIDSYGLLLTIMAYIYLTSSSFGSVLNNSRLIHNNKYKNLNMTGDFSIFLLGLSIINTILSIILVKYIASSIDLTSKLILIGISFLMLVNTYAVVEYRIRLNFKNILLNSFALLFGYLFGYILFLYTGYWTLIYLFGFIFSFIHITATTYILKEKYVKTKLYKQTKKEMVLLLASGFLISIGTYADKLIIYPLLGGAAVTIYNTSTLVGKTISLAIGPITGVMLSYLSHMENFKRNTFKILLVLSTVLGIIGYFIIVYISTPILGFIYPQYLNDTVKYIPITTLNIIITIICSAINPLLLRFLSAKWQLYINIIYIIFYIVVSLILLKLYGLYGLCLGILLSNIIKLGMMVLIYLNVNTIKVLEKVEEI